MMDTFDKTVAGVCVAAVVALAGLIYWAFEDTKQWQKYAEENGCEVVEKLPDSVIVTMQTITDGRGGVTMYPVTTIVPGARKWVCKNGAVHWR